MPRMQNHKTSKQVEWAGACVCETAEQMDESKRFPFRCDDASHILPQRLPTQPAGLSFDVFLFSSGIVYNFEKEGPSTSNAIKSSPSTRRCTFCRCI